MIPDEVIRKDIQQLYNSGKFVGYVDEVGRGPIAGPLCTACVVLDNDTFFDERVDDSKKISKGKMNELSRHIKDNVVCWAIGVVTIKELNQMQNLHTSTLLALKRAIQAVSRKPDIVYLDGPHAIPNLNIPQKAIIDGDAKIFGVACASIIAKDFRDTYMKAIAVDYPEYLWAQNAGYGTKAHLEAIQEYGLTKHHRTWYKVTKEVVKC